MIIELDNKKTLWNFYLHPYAVLDTVFLIFSDLDCLVCLNSLCCFYCH